MNFDHITGTRAKKNMDNIHLNGLFYPCCGRFGLVDYALADQSTKDVNWHQRRR
jgi:hypothetical protein